MGEVVLPAVDPALLKKETKQNQQDRAKTMLELMIEQFLKHKLAVACLITLSLLVLMAISAPIITAVLGVSPEDQNIMSRYLPPMSRVESPADKQEAALEKLIAKDPAFVSALAAQAKAANLVPADEADAEIPFMLSDKLSNPEEAEAVKAIGSREVKALVSFKQAFAVTHLLGTDELGRDVLARLVYGARVSLSVAFLVGLCAAVIGLFVGSLAGFYGGFVDTGIMRIVDGLLALPTLPLMIVLAAVDFKRFPVVGGLVTGESESMLKMVIILGAFSWLGIARLVRGAVLSLKENEYVLSARTIGTSDFQIMFRHIAPNVMGPLLVGVTLNTGAALLQETALSFLGLGIQPPMPSWGNMLQNALELVSAAPLLAILPGVMIFVVVICVNSIGDGLRDALDPKAIRR
jgi:peptide/nickel transport system permease protein